MLRQWTVDAFAGEPFKGNPACVVEPFDAWPSDAWMQSLAQENNQAETAFLLTTGDAARFGIRWFTPTMEAPFCGHATLAAAHVLFVDAGLRAGEVVFDTRSKGAFRVAPTGEGYRMDLPADPPRRIAGSARLTEALGLEPTEVHAGQYLLAVLESEAAVRAAAPDIAALARLGEEASSGRGNVILAAIADPASPYEVISRFFAPGSGIAEDPTTGSAHTLLAPLFSDRLGRKSLRFHQAFPGRGGDLVVEAADDRVMVHGRAVTVMDTTLRLSPA